MMIKPKYLKGEMKCSGCLQVTFKKVFIFLAAHITGEKNSTTGNLCLQKRKRYILTHILRAKRAELLPGISSMETLPSPKEYHFKRHHSTLYLHLDCKETDLNFLLDSLIFRDARVSWSVKGPLFEKDCGLLSVHISHIQQNIYL